MPSQFWQRKSAAGCSMCVADTCAAVCLCTMGTSNLQNLTANCLKCSFLLLKCFIFFLRSVWWAGKFHLFDGSDVYSSLVFWVLFLWQSGEGADIDRLSRASYQRMNTHFKKGNTTFFKLYILILWSVVKYVIMELPGWIFDRFITLHTCVVMQRVLFPPLYIGPLHMNKITQKLWHWLSN